MQFLDEIISLIENSIRDDAEQLITWWNIIKDWFSAEIDADKEIVTQGHFWISQYQKTLIELTHISSLKIKFTQNFWYFIEIQKSHISKIPDFFIQRQSLLQAYRYTTEELQDFEEKLFSATQTLAQKEYDTFLSIRDTVVWHFHDIYNISRKIGYVDYLSNGASISSKRNYKTPVFSQKYDIEIVAGKHPVLALWGKEFVSNDLNLSRSEFVHVITGPNMGGKSTFLRQNALLLLMAHMWYDIPCQEARIWKIDKIFSRVGAGDNLYLGQSTFMVEMQEIAYILRSATQRSFIIIDEIGRGTSTYDGMSLAWAILQYNHTYIKAKTLFATHYHEIIDHAKQLSGVKNFSVAVGENNENIVFLRKIIPGGIKKSYGIEVAKLAGMPDTVLSLAKNMMQELEKSQKFQQLSLIGESIFQEKESKDLEKYESVFSYMRKLDLNTLTPLQSLQALYEIQDQVKKIK